MKSLQNPQKHVVSKRAWIGQERISRIIARLENVRTPEVIIHQQGLWTLMCVGHQATMLQSCDGANPSPNMMYMPTAGKPYVRFASFLSIALCLGVGVGWGGGAC